MRGLTAKLNRIAPWRFMLFFVLLLCGCALSIPLAGWSKGMLLGFDPAAIAFLVSCFPSFRYDAQRMRQVAVYSDANRVTLLIVSFLLTIVILAAVIAELSLRDQLTAFDKGIVAATLVLIWTFGNAVYTLHYAHLFYSPGKDGRDSGGLDFPETQQPLMSDFVYFAFTLGVAVQTSDVQVTSPAIRKVVTAHCVAGFFFNLGVLALTINVLGSS
jgi:uncharacterized membrane protein